MKKQEELFDFKDRMAAADGEDDSLEMVDSSEKKTKRLTLEPKEGLQSSGERSPTPHLKLLQNNVLDAEVFQSRS